MQKRSDLTALTSFASELPRSRIGLVRFLWPTIQACLEAGHRIRAVHARLEADGIEIPYSTLCWAIASMQRQNRNGQPEQAKPPAAQRLEKSGKRDPLANLRRLARDRPGFEYSGTLPDEDLFGRK